MKGNYKMDTNVQQISSDVNTDTPPASHDVGKHLNTTTNYDMSLVAAGVLLFALALGIMQGVVVTEISNQLMLEPEKSIFLEEPKDTLYLAEH
jgi:hypothetical protein